MWKRERPNYTRELLIAELQAAYTAAMASGQVSSGVSALKLQAQLMGYLEQVVNVNHTVSARDLPLADLRRMVAERMPERGLPVLIEGTVAGDAGDDGE